MDIKELIDKEDADGKVAEDNLAGGVHRWCSRCGRYCLHAPDPCGAVPEYCGFEKVCRFLRKVSEDE